MSVKKKEWATRGVRVCVCVCACVCVRERKRESVAAREVACKRVFVCETEIDRVDVCVCVSWREREKEKGN